jgi:hypothetical protein
MIKNVLESTAIYYTNKERMISLAVDVSNNLRDIIYIGLDNGKIYWQRSHYIMTIPF